MESRHILLVEDDETNREGLRTLLELWGHRVDEAATGERAIEMAITTRPDIVLLDIGLPDLSGYEVARRIRRAPGNDNVVLIALTGYGELDDQPSDARFDRHVLKPIDCDALRDLMAAVPAGGRASH